MDGADTAPVGGLDGEAQAVHLDRVTDLGDAADVVVDEAADGVELLLVVAVQRGVEVLQQVVHVGPPVDPRLVLAEGHDHGLLLVVLVLDLAHDLLDEVLDGDEAGRAAVLVEDDGDVDATSLQAVQEVVDEHRLGHEERRAHEAADGGWPIVADEVGQQVLGVEEAHDVVDAAVVDGDARVALRPRWSARSRPARRRPTRATMSTRATMTSWTRRSPSSRTPPIICSSSASMVPCSPPRSTRMRSSSLVMASSGTSRTPSSRVMPCVMVVSSQTTGASSMPSELDGPGQRQRVALGVGQGQRLGHQLAEDDGHEADHEGHDEQGQDVRGRLPAD